MENLLENINCALWIGLIILALIVLLVNKAKKKSWNEGVDNTVVGVVPFRDRQTQDRNVFFEGVLYVLGVIVVFFIMAAIFTTPLY
jgi:hypothetical protein